MKAQLRWALAGRQVSVVVVVVEEDCIGASVACTGAWQLGEVHKMAWVVTEVACMLAWVGLVCIGASVVEVVVVALACTGAWACKLVVVGVACRKALVGVVSSVVRVVCMMGA